MKTIASPRTLFLALALAVLPAGLAGAQDEAATVRDLLQDLRSRDGQAAYGAASELGKFPRSRAQIVPALLQALKTQEWDRCGGDIRQVIADALVKLKAKEGVLALLELVKSGRETGHECAECGCCFNPMTPADVLAERESDPFCENRVLAAIHELADATHSKAMADLVTEGKARPELLITIGKVGPPRYAHFISRYKDDRDVGVRLAVAHALGLIDNPDVSVPVLVQLLSRGASDEDFIVKWEASTSLIKIGKRKKSEGLTRRAVGLLGEKNKITISLSARTLAALGEAQGLVKLRELATDADAKVRAEAVLELAELADAGSKDLLIKRLQQDDDATVRAYAIYALGQIGDPSVIPILRKAVEESAGKVTPETYDLKETLQQAIEVLQKRGGR